MYEIIKKQFHYGATFRDHHGALHGDKFPKFHWDMYPLAQEYYHELNPYYLYNVYRPGLFNLVDVITARDGYLTFAYFLLENIKTIPKMGCHFIIHPKLVPLVPLHLTKYFSCWKLRQPKQLSLSTAKKVIIFSLISHEYIGDLDRLSFRLKVLSEIAPETSVELFLPEKKDIFGRNNTERIIYAQFLSELKDYFPGRKLKFLKIQDFFDITDFRDTYFFDVAFDHLLTTDNYLHYYVQSRGGTVNNDSLQDFSAESIFHLEASLYHEFHVVPFPKDVQSVFAEVIFYKKMHPAVEDLRFDPFFQNLLGQLLKTRA